MPDTTREAFSELDRVLDHRVRFAICALLSRNERLSFSRFKELLDQTDGALGAQLRKLEDETYITVDKVFEQRRPVSWYELTALGRKQLQRHVDALQQMLDLPKTQD